MVVFHRFGFSHKKGKVECFIKAKGNANELINIKPQQLQEYFSLC